MKLTEAVLVDLSKYQDIVTLINAGVRVSPTLAEELAALGGLIGGARRQLVENAQRQGLDITKLLTKQAAQNPEGSLSKWNLARATLDRLAGQGIATVSELTSKTRSEVREIPGMDLISFTALCSAMKKRGVDFKKD